MNTTRKIACLCFLSVIAACTPAGYYDSNGQYRSYGQSDSFRHEHALAGTPDANVYSEDRRPDYYEHDSGYIEENSGLNIPKAYLPPHGMCRVWFADRPLRNQPAVE